MPKRRFVIICNRMILGRFGWVTEGVRHNFIVQSGLPIDARLVDAGLDSHGDLRLWFTHPSFEDSDPDEIVVTCQMFARK
jgi:hypothetical protein